MVYVKIKGGLGNQMYQYAFAKAYGIRHKLPVVLDMDPIRHAVNRPYALQHFAVDTRIRDHSRGAVNQFKNLFFYMSLLIRGKYVLERQGGFRKNLLEKRRESVYFDGYWQSFRYFEAIRSQLLHDFALKEPLSTVSKQWAAQIQAQHDAIFIHVRRGDYVTVAKNRAMFLALPISYYQEAVQHIVAKHPQAVVFVFSNDMAWVKENLHFTTDTYYVEGNDEEHGYEDMYLMSLCRHHVIANSSFSWWGAWLSRQDGMTIAPSRTSVDTQQPDTSDFYPSDWEKIVV